MCRTLLVPPLPLPSDCPTPPWPACTGDQVSLRVYRLEGLPFAEVAEALRQHLGPTVSIAASATNRGFWYTTAPRPLWSHLAGDAPTVEVPLPCGKSFGITDRRSDGTPVQRQLPATRPPPIRPPSEVKRLRPTDPSPGVLLPPPFPPPFAQPPHGIQYRALPSFPWKDLLHPPRDTESRSRGDRQGRGRSRSPSPRPRHQPPASHSRRGSSPPQLPPPRDRRRSLPRRPSSPRRRRPPRTARPEPLQ